MMEKEMSTGRNGMKPSNPHTRDVLTKIVESLLQGLKIIYLTI